MIHMVGTHIRSTLIVVTVASLFVAIACPSLASTMEGIKKQDGDPCAGCDVIEEHLSDFQEYLCMITIDVCVNLTCVSEWCIIPGYEQPILRTLQNVFGDPNCECSIIPEEARCRTQRTGSLAVGDRGGPLPPCTRLYILTHFEGKEAYHTIRLSCPTDSIPQERIIIYKLTECPVSYRVVPRVQPEPGCCPFLEPLPLPVSEY